MKHLWLNIHFPTPPNKDNCLDMPDTQAVALCLLKWEGLTEKELAQYGLRYYCGEVLYKGELVLDIDITTCHLCQKYTSTNSTVNERGEMNDCVNCPIYRMTGHDCCTDYGRKISPWHSMRKSENPYPMIRLLKDTLNWLITENTFIILK